VYAGGHRDRETVRCSGCHARFPAPLTVVGIAVAVLLVLLVREPALPALGVGVLVAGARVAQAALRWGTEPAAGAGPETARLADRAAARQRASVITSTTIEAIPKVLFACPYLLL
jgi:hypothetical protein